ncbi:uncharacterized protein DS421_13g402650 [Arachis hypogaea]|nr:uncharacterized protein DS421_13g402650 [Arachis hypogaea]
MKEEEEVYVNLKEEEYDICVYLKEAQGRRRRSAGEEKIGTKIDDTTNHFLNPVTEKAIKATFSINPFSAPKDDGFTAKFFQFYWELIRKDVICAVKSFFSGGKMLKAFNHTNICLIPKVRNAYSMKQVRPISLSSVFYKILSKILEHRLQNVMNRVISDTQNAFIKGRLISNNILIVHKFMYFLKNKTYGDYELALKLDMSKAYDRVEWSFVWIVLNKMGFYKKWIDRIRECVDAVSYSITVEG